MIALTATSKIKIEARLVELRALAAETTAVVGQFQRQLAGVMRERRLGDELRSTPQWIAPGRAR